MKKILALAVCVVVVVSTAFTQVLTKAGVQNTLWTGFGEMYPEAGKSPDIRFYGLYDTLQARVDVSSFTIDAMLNWAAETNWEFNRFQNITFVNTQKTPFYYTNHSGQGGDKTSGYTDSLYVNFIWNAIAKNKHDLDFGMGSRLSWVIGPAPSCYGCYWEPLTHIPQGGLKDAAPGTADVAGYTSYDNNYADHALGIRYRYSDFIEAGISIPSGVNTDKPFFNAAFAIKPMDVFRVSLALENIGNDSTDLYTGLSLYFKKVTVDAYFEYCFGNLEYRSVDIKFKTVDKEFYQEAPVVNYPNDYDFTRITEFKHMTGEKSDKTVICMEYPKQTGHPYYVVMTKENMEKREKYMAEVKALEDTKQFIFTGRLAEYKYFNMDQAIKSAMDKIKGIL